MRRNRSILATLWAILSLTLVAAGARAAGCAAVDWDLEGYRDGNHGQPMHRIGRYQRECANSGGGFDRDRYLAGRARGLQNYCQPQTGYEAGAQGQQYLGACPHALEPAFLDAFRAGARIHSVRRLITQIDRQLAWYENRLQSGAVNQSGRPAFVAEIERLLQRKHRYEQRLDEYAVTLATVD